jgi:hypothetical protein
MLYHIPAKLVLQLRNEMYQTEGANFTEMCMDGIPERKAQKMDVEQMSV